MVDQVRIIADELQAATEKVVAAIATNVTAELIDRTPVDINWARSNWVPALGSAYTGGAFSRAEQQDVTAASSTQQAGLADVARYRLSQGRVFVTNNVPYITILNQGSSRQAPAGFVQDGIDAGVKSVRGLRL